jgi:septal ring factor EnvC (AmiA/AmiB activator)
LAKAKAEREKRLAEQRARAEKRAAEAARAAKEGKPAPKMPDPADAIDDDEPPQQASLGRNDTLPEPQADNFGKPFASLRGQLHLPVKGDLMSKFGSRRGDGPTSRGLFIRATRGGSAGGGGRTRGLRGLVARFRQPDHRRSRQPVHDHLRQQPVGAQTRRRPGQGRETIATAGNSGGNEQSGLYFEMRYQGRAFDPQGWVTSR